MSWWNELTELQKIFAYIAIPATGLMIIQFVMLLFGFVNGGGADADTDAGIDMDDGLSHDILDINDGLSHDISAIDGSDAVPELSDGVSEVFSHDTADVYDEFDQDTAETHDTSAALRLFTLRGIIAFLTVGGWMGVAAIEWKLSNLVSVVLAVGAGWLALYFVAWTIRAFLRMQYSGTLRLENAIGKEGDVYLTIPAGGRGKVNVIVQDRLCEIDAVSKSDRDIKTGEKVTVLGIDSEGVLLVEEKSCPETTIVERASQAN
jgi:membrane protein implicated in regulation of membrane protease activity